MTPLPKTLHYHHLSFTHCHSPFPLPSSTFSFRPQPPHHFLSSSIKASSSSSSPSPKPQNPFSQLLKYLNPFYSPLIEPAYVAVALLAFFLFRVQRNPATVTSPLPPPPAQSSTATATTATSPLPPPPEADENLSTTENDNYLIDDVLIETCNDVTALRSLVEEKVKAKKLGEAIRAVDRIIDLEPEDLGLQLLKAHLHCYNGEHELAKNGFELTLSRDPLNSEAYRGLLMASFELKEPLEGFLSRVDEVVKFFEEEKMELEAREFKLLIAQVKVMQEDYSAALKVYEEIVKDEPSDYRPYLCRGVVYTLLKKNDEAAKQFEEYRKLVPENHPYKEIFEDNTQILSKKLEKGGIEAKISE